MKLISLNIERDKHLRSRSLPFLEAEAADVVCLQEVLARDVIWIAGVLQLPHFSFWPMLSYPMETGPEPMGIALFSRHPVKRWHEESCGGEGNGLMVFDETSPATKFKTARFGVLAADVVTPDGTEFRILTTHFPVTAQGGIDAYQRTACTNFLKVCADLGPLVAVGDFNAPRGRETFDRLCEKFTDNIPPHHTTSLDGNLHRAGPLPFMVDGYFTQPPYMARNVRLQDGVSDHMAVVGDVFKIEL